MPQKRNPWTIVAAGTVAIVSLLYLNQLFFFTPLAYKHCAAAHLPWTWYKNPLQLEYGVLDEDGWKFTKVTDKDEIKKIFVELSHCVQEPVSDELEIAGDGPPVWFGIRRLTDGAVLLSAEGLEDSPYFQVRDLATIYLTPELQTLLDTRLKQARM